MGLFTTGVTPPKIPENRTAKAKPYGTLRVITASGQKVNVSDRQEVDSIANRKHTHKWQDEAWEYFDAIGEINYAYTVFSNVLSRIRLYAAYVEDDQDSPTPLKQADISDEDKKAIFKAMNRVFGTNNQSQLLRRAGLNLLVSGECYLVCETNYIGGRNKEDWKIVSNDELVAIDGGLALKKSKNAKMDEYIKVKNTDFVGRIWKEHPRYSDDATSALKPLCGLCNDLLLLSRTVRATARSRLNAGVFFIPEEFSVAHDAPTDAISDDEDLEDYVEDEDEEFEQAMIDLMGTPVEDEASVMALVPLIIRGPAELGDKLRHISFERVFDPQLAERADRSLERILQGLDMPKEMITGLADIKYSNAVQINESFYTGHIEPLVLMLCDTFKIVYLEPALLQAGLDPELVEKLVIWYDPSGIVTAPDKSSAANVGHDKFALSDEAWRRANGFTDDDAPSRREIVQRIAISRGVLTPELTDTLFRTLDPELMDQVRAQTLAQQGSPMSQDVQNLLDPNSAQAPPADPTETAGAPTTGSEPQQDTEQPTEVTDSEVDPDTLPTTEELFS